MQHSVVGRVLPFCVAAIVLALHGTAGLSGYTDATDFSLRVDCHNPSLPAWSSPGCPLWDTRYAGNAYHTEHAGVLVNPDGTLVVTWGFDGGYFQGNHFVAAHEPLTGLPLWRAQPGIAVREVAVGYNEVLYVAGATQAPPQEQQTVVVTLDAVLGTELSRTVLPAPPGYPMTLTLGPDSGNIYVAVFHPTVGEGGATTLFALEAENAKVLWSRGLDRVNLNTLVVDSEGWGVAAGSHCPPDAQWSCLNVEHDLFVQTWDAATGEPRWTTLYDGDHGEDRALRAWIPDATSILIAGITTEPNGDRLLIARLDSSDGAIDWMDAYTLHGMSDRLSGAALSPDGAIVFLSTLGTWSAEAGVVAAVVAYAAQTGDRLWETPYSIPPPPGRDQPFTMVYDLALDSSGTRLHLGGMHLDGSHDYPCLDTPGSPGGLPLSVWVCPTHPQPCRGAPDIFVATLAAVDGDVLWTTTYDFDGHADYAHALAIYPDNSRLFVAGASALRATSPYVGASPPPDDDFIRCLSPTVAATLAAFSV